MCNNKLYLRPLFLKAKQNRGCSKASNNASKKGTNGNCVLLMIHEITPIFIMTHNHNINIDDVIVCKQLCDWFNSVNFYV